MKSTGGSKALAAGVVLGLICVTVFMPRGAAGADVPGQAGQGGGKPAEAKKRDAGKSDEGALSIVVRFQDKSFRLLTGVNFFSMNAQGKWVAGGVTDESGLGRFTVDGYGPVKVGVTFEGDEAKEPRLVDVVQVKRVTQGSAEQRRDAQRYGVALDYDAGKEMMRQAIKKLERIVFEDAVGKPMPAGTQVTFIGKDSKPVKLTLDEKAPLKGNDVARIYHENFKVSHPAYGTAEMTGMVLGKESGTVKVPLVKEEDAGDALVIKGRVVDKAGKPVSGVRVMGYPASSVTKSYGLIALFGGAVTDTEGVFRYRAPYKAEAAKEIKERANGGELFEFRMVPEDRWYMPSMEKRALGKPMEFTLEKGDREVVVSFVGVDGEALSPQEMSMAKLNVEGKAEFEMGLGWVPESGKLVLAYGTYVFKSRDRGMECLLEFKADSPAKVELGPDSPVILTTGVVDPATQKIVSDALVLATDMDLVAVDVGAFTKDTWEQLGKLKNPVSVKDLPQQVVEMVKPRQAALSDDLGQVLIRPGGMFKPSRTITLVVLKEGRFPTVGVMRCPEKVSRGVFEVMPLPAPMSATLELTFEALPGDLPPQYKGDPEMRVFTSGFTVMELPGPDASLAILITPVKTIKLESTKRRLCVPAEMDFGFMVIRSRIGLTQGEGDYASFYMPVKSMRVKAGETVPVTMTRKRVFEQKFKLVGPDGKSVSKSQMAMAEEDVQEWRGINTFGMNDNAFGVWVTPGNAFTLGLWDRRNGGYYHEFEFAAMEKAVAEPMVIRLTQEQVEMVRNSMGAH